MYRKGTSIRQAPVFRHLRALRKSPWSLLSGWMNYNYTACCWFPTSSNILILPSQFWQIRFESCWLHWSKCRILVLLWHLHVCTFMSGFIKIPTLLMCTCLLCTYMYMYLVDVSYVFLTLTTHPFRLQMCHVKSIIIWRALVISGLTFTSFSRSRQSNHPTFLPIFYWLLMCNFDY